MDNGKVEAIIENEKEWRKHLVVQISDVKSEQTRQGKDIANLKVWAWISRSAILGSFGLMFAWVKTKLGKL
jgi:hypothetical protein